jgi:16S rRNA C967 or C1407 C5-methylase (RsmB/RsmF family)/NOL1/NOP2/fmu family ribosome biogenesis protein
MFLPPAFVRQMQDLLGNEFASFETSLREDAPVSVRHNPKKVPTSALTLALGDKVAWHPNAHYLLERPIFTLDPAFHAGAYYVQEASSMFLHEALRQAMDLSKPIKALDLCAAPGGKSTLLLDTLHPESLVLANEVIRSRINPLKDNLCKWGRVNTAISGAEAEHFAALPGFFDLIVADAPCSGEGMFRKDPDAIKEWSPDHVQHCALRQRRILSAAVEALAGGGVLAFSTCTFNVAENDENAAWLESEFDLERINLSLDPAWGILEKGGNHHFFPHRTKGEGFYIALFRKKGETPNKRQNTTAYKMLKPLPKAQVPGLREWIGEGFDLSYYLTAQDDVIAFPTALEPDFLRLDQVLSAKWYGVHLGAFKGKDFIPAHALALNEILAARQPRIELDREQALLYLKRENFNVNSASMGWALASYQGLPLGWMKILPNRINNYLPAEWRIRMDLR